MTSAWTGVGGEVQRNNVDQFLTWGISVESEFRIIDDAEF